MILKKQIKTEIKEFVISHKNTIFIEFELWISEDVLSTK